MKTLHLNVKKEFFDMIEDLIKKEEYRTIKPYWVKRLAYETETSYNIDFFYNNVGYKFKTFDQIEIKNGYQKNAPKLLIDFKGVDIGYPNPNWIGMQFGTNERVFRIKLGEVKE